MNINLTVRPESRENLPAWYAAACYTETRPTRIEPDD
jgi:hypothetical protein